MNASVTVNTFGTWSCNCACMTCLGGSCCLTAPSGPVNIGTITWPMAPSGPVNIGTITWPMHTHNFAKFDEKRIFCITCGEFRTA